MKKILYIELLFIIILGFIISYKLAELSKVTKKETYITIKKITPLKPKLQQKIKYILEFEDKSDIKYIKKILKPFDRTCSDDFYIYKIPETEIKIVLKQFMIFKVNIQKQNYKDATKYYQIVIKKELLDFIEKK